MTIRPGPKTLTLVLLAIAARPSLGADPSGKGIEFFEAKVRPILQAQCISCHGGEKTRGSLKLTGREAILKGGDTGPAVNPDRPDESLLLKALTHDDEDLKMPPKGKLAQAQIDTLREWVRMGAPWPAGAATAHSGPPQVDDKARNFWSFKPVVRPAVPAVRGNDWVRSPIDAFILAKLETAGYRPAPAADKATLLRRVYYDLTGLPPSPADVDAFMADPAPDAYERVVDKLLASPQYGEKWARHWLDLVRFCETNGYEFDTAKPSAWRFRDYVIQSFNADKPYDKFVREQLAGDEIAPGSVEPLIATGYFRLGPWDSGSPDKLQAQYDELDDIVSTTGQAFLGLSVGCARCHDHKSDPFPQADYYRLMAFVHNVQRFNPRSSVKTIGSEAEAELQKEEIAAFKERLNRVVTQIKEIEDDLRPHLTGGELDDFEQHPEARKDIIRKHVPEHVAVQDYETYAFRIEEKVELEKKRPSGLAQALCVAEGGKTAPETFVLMRGNPRSPGAKVEPGFPSVLTTATTPVSVKAPDGVGSSGRRTALADWIASPENPLTARVMANRVWQFHLGRGIVRSGNDFGYKGTPPTHPELLDWLASEFVSMGWKLKPFHKLIVTSNTYRMSSQPNTEALAKDPANDLFWRFDQRRLSAEEIRDSVLAVSGNLNRAKMGGPSIYPKLPREVLFGQSMPGSGWGKTPAEDATRRSVYIYSKRSLPVPFMAVFDAADPDASCPARFVTTQPTQALTMLNGEFLNDQAKLFADDTLSWASSEPTALVRLALRRVTQREPSEKEIARGVAFLANAKEKHKLTPVEALRSFCLLALNLNEFVYLD